MTPEDARRRRENDRLRRDLTRRKLNAIKQGRGCKRCGETDPAVLQFHHRDPATKRYDVSKMLGMAWERVLEEIDKCDVLCACCHQRHHGDEHRGRRGRRGRG